MEIVLEAGQGFPHRTSPFDAARAGQTVAHLAHAEFGGRASGTLGGQLAASWIADRLAQLGFAVSSQSFPIDHALELYASPTFEIVNTRGQVTARLEHRRQIAEHPRSAEAPEPISAPVARLSDGTAAGAWVAVDALHPSATLDEVTAHLAEAGAIGVLMPQAVGTDGYLTKRVVWSRPVALPVIAVRADLLRTLDGKIVTADMPLRTRNMSGRNVVGRLAGSADASPVLLTAHYDGVGDDPGSRNPAAADNASGVAVLLEVARTLAGGPQLRRSVWIAALDAEERGALGSAAHARELKEDELRAEVMNLDMAGRRHPTVAIEAGAGADRTLEALDAAGRELGIGLAFASVPSDNRRYAGAGFSSVGVALGAAGYHSPADHPSVVDRAALDDAGRLLIATLARLFR